MVQNTLEPKKEVALPDVRVIWGRTLLAIKQAGKIMLHSVCINLGKIVLDNNTLKVHVPGRLDYEVLKKPQNCGDLVDTLHKLGYNLNIEFVLDESAGGNMDKISMLRGILGADIKILN